MTRSLDYEAQQGKGFGLVNVNYRKGERVRKPGGAAQALNHSLGLHNGSKRWCEWLPDAVLGPP